MNPPVVVVKFPTVVPSVSPGSTGPGTSSSSQWTVIGTPVIAVPPVGRNVLLIASVPVWNPRLTRVPACRTMLNLVLVLSKILIIVASVGLMRSSPKIQSMSREMDERAFAALRRIIRATEESGYPPQLIPLLMLLTALTFMLSMYLTGAYVR